MLPPRQTTGSRKPDEWREKREHAIESKRMATVAATPIDDGKFLATDGQNGGEKGS